MRMKKKLTAAALVVAFGATAIAGGTLAYFTDTKQATNTFTVGNVSITLTETEWEGPAQSVYPGEALGKNPVVTNAGDNPCYVRVAVTGLDSLAPAGVIQYRTDDDLDALGTNWVDGNDGYFYYTQVLAVGEWTDALFDEIVIPTGVTNGSTGKSYNVDVKAEAVQAEGINAADPDHVTFEEIQTWFNELMPTV